LLGASRDRAFRQANLGLGSNLQDNVVIADFPNRSEQAADGYHLVAVMEIQQELLLHRPPSPLGLNDQHPEDDEQ
jgi:hypothetical protein